MPPGGEDEAVRFYSGLLGIPQRAKPAELGARGGCWFESGDLKLHLGVEEDFRPARKAHPALLVEGLSGLTEKLDNAGCQVVEGDRFDGSVRIYLDDPFGNRIELVGKQAC